MDRHQNSLFFQGKMSGLRGRTISQLQNQSEGVPMNDKGRRALLMGGAAASLQLWWLRVLTKKFHFYGNITHEAQGRYVHRRSDCSKLSEL